MTSKVQVDRRGSVTVLTLSRPEVLNCIDGETAAGITEAVEGFAEDESAHVLVITGMGDRAFCTGADLKNLDSLWGPDSDRVGPCGFARLDPGKPTIAAVNGYAFAAGTELACWCDFRIASENAEFGVLNRRWGVSLIDGGTQFLPRIVGEGNALWMVETGVRIDAKRALAIGLVQEVVPAGEALPRALALAGEISNYPNPKSLRADRNAAISALGVSLPEGLAAEYERGAPTVAEPEVAEALRNFAAGLRPEPPRPPEPQE